MALPIEDVGSRSPMRSSRQLCEIPKVALGVVLALLAQTCSTGRLTPEMHTAVPGPVEMVFEQLHDPTADKYWKVAIDRENPFKYSRLDQTAVTEIYLERTFRGIEGLGPSYTVRFLRSGRVDYFGQQYVKRLGCYRATFDSSDFLELAVAAEGIGFWDLEDAYVLLATDQPSTYTMLTTPDRRKVVWNYGNSGPMRLWLFEQHLDHLTQGLDWQGMPAAKSATQCLELDTPALPGTKERSLLPG